MPWKCFQWKRWMALKKILCIFLQNKAQGLDKARESGTCWHCKVRTVTPVLVAEVALPCPAALALPGLQQYQQPQNSLFGDTARMCQLEQPIVPQGNDFLTQIEALSASPGAWAYIQNTTHPQAPEMNPSTPPLVATRP